MIYINGRFLGKPMTGVQRFASEIVKAFDKKEYSGKFTILIPKDLEGMKKKPSYIPVQVVGKHKGNLWEQFSLPRFLEGKKDAQLLNLCNSSPLSVSGYTTIHDLGFLHNPKTYRPSFTHWYRFMIKRKVKKDRLIFTISDFSKNDIVDTYGIDPNKVIEVSCGSDHILNIVPDNRILDEYGIRGQEYFLAVGTNYPHKNLDLVRKFALEHPDKVVVLVSQKPKDPASAEIANAIYIERNVTSQELKSLYRNAYLFFMPSEFEGFGLPPMEAMLSGTKRILLSDIPVFREKYGDIPNYFRLEEGRIVLPERLKEVSPEDILAIGRKYAWDKTAKIIMESIENDICQG